MESDLPGQAQDPHPEWQALILGWEPRVNLPGAEHQDGKSGQDKKLGKAHVWGGCRGWNREWRPHLGAPSRFAPAEGGATRGAGAWWEAEGIPWSEAFGKSIAEQSGFP